MPRVGTLMAAGWAVTALVVGFSPVVRAPPLLPLTLAGALTVAELVLYASDYDAATEV